MTAKVVVRDLEKSYGAVQAARGISFDVHGGEVFGLLGPNGAGKTTTVECVIGLREPDSGRIEVCGLDARRERRGVKQKIGAALQTTALQDKITPREALDLFGSFYERRTAAAPLLDRFALADKAGAPFDSLSGGERQRLALALAFVNNPELVFLDEPTSGLDPQSRRDLHAEIGRMRRDGATVLLTTHQLDEAELLCDRVAIIDHGRIIATGAPLELIAGSRTTQSVQLSTIEPLDPADLAALPGVEDLLVDGLRARFRTERIESTLTALMSLVAARRVELSELRVQKATLEEVFMELTGRDRQASGSPPR